MQRQWGPWLGWEELGGQSQEGPPGTRGPDSAFCSYSYKSWTLLAENECLCHVYEQLRLPVLSGACSFLPSHSWDSSPVPRSDISKWRCLTPSVLLTTSQGDWMHTNLSLCFLQTDPQEASTTPRSAMFCFNLVM